MKDIFEDKGILSFWLMLPLAIFFLSAPLNNAQAQTAAPNACDPEYYSTLKSAAWMQAQREIMQNQNLIYKPDSVLEYTCFDQHLKVVASYAKDMFSENPRWGTDGLGSMGTSLANLSGKAFASYILANFELSPTGGEFDLLGGRLNDANIDYPTGTLNVNNLANEIINIADGYDYQCDVMNQVWMQAKCMDFIQNEDTDAFFSLADYSTKTEDVRQLPAACVPYVTQTKWGNEYANVNSTNVDDTPWVEDPILTYSQRITGVPAGAAALNCATTRPIATGLIARDANGLIYSEGVCVAAGCNYVPSKVPPSPTGDNAPPVTAGLCSD